MLKLILRFIFRLCYRIEVNGKLDVFDNPRTLIVANHESFIDGVLIGLFLPVTPTFIIHSTVVERPLFRFLLRLSRAKYLAIDSTNPMGMKKIVKLVESGEPVVIFPEGRITVTGSLMKVYDGASFVAARTGATIIPVRLAGVKQTYFSRLAGLYRRFLFPKITIYVRTPTHIPLSGKPRARDRRVDAGHQMRALLTRMLVETRARRTFYTAFLDAMDSFGRHTKVVEDVRLNEESYATILKMILGMSRLFSKMTAHGEMVGVLLPNATPALGAIFGLSACGRVPAMLNFTAGNEGLNSAFTAAQIRTVLTSRAFLEKGRLEHLPTTFTTINWVYLEDFKAKLTGWDKLWLLPRLIYPRLAIDPKQRPDDPAVVLFTSGSEGRPKGVVHSHDAILSNITQVRSVIDIQPHDKFMIVLPFFHSFGLTVGAMLPLICGCKSFLYPSPLHYRIIPELTYDRNCTVLLGTPTFLGNYARFAHPYDFSRLRYVISGAEKLEENVRNTYFDRFGLRILEGYGITECAPVVSVNVPMAYKAGSVGQLMPGMNYQLRSVEGVDPECGILEVQGPNIMKGYLRFENPGVIEAPVVDEDGKNGGSGWYPTGDVVFVDADGFIFIRGRLKRFAKLAGEMISLEVVEKIARETSPDKLHAVTTRPDASKGEALVLFTTDTELGREKLLATARRLGAPELAVPRDIRRIDKIPVLGSGKTDYVGLHKMAQAAGVSGDAVDE